MQEELWMPLFAMGEDDDDEQKDDDTDDEGDDGDW